jgi:hypothetical protein
MSKDNLSILLRERSLPVTGNKSRLVDNDESMGDPSNDLPEWAPDVGVDCSVMENLHIIDAQPAQRSAGIAEVDADEEDDDDDDDENVCPISDSDDHRRQYTLAHQESDDESDDETDDEEEGN